jgi:hypothetical protein
MIADINWLAVLVAAVVTFVLGGLWYGPLFGMANSGGPGHAGAGHRKHLRSSMACRSG